jgi:flagellar hook-length control protein FliK
LDGSAASVDLHEQVAPVIVREARLVSVGGNHELTVRLEPDHLGPLHVRLSLVEGALSVGLTTATTDAQRALETALPQLRGALVDSGLRLDRLDVSLRDSGNGNQRGGSDSSGRGNDGRPGAGSGDGYQSRQFEGRPDGSPSFADVLFDQDGRVFGPASRGARALGYRAYGRGRSR